VDEGFRFAPGRPAAVAAEAMVATSQPLATLAGLRALERGGNAADAALAAAAMLCVTEPMSTGIGGDAFALVFEQGRLHGLDAAGPAPARADRREPVDEHGPRSVTVPGAVGGWIALAERHGRLGVDTCLADAIDVAERGFAVAARTAVAWSGGTRTGATGPSLDLPDGYGPAPSPGDRVRLPALAATLRLIASSGGDALYAGAVARAICDVSWLEEDDLSAYAPRWVSPLQIDYRGHTVVELPPPTQGVAVLEALGLLEGMAPDLPNQVRCAGLALEDAFEHVRDGADTSALLDPAYLAERRRQAPRAAAEPGGGTVYLCAVDGGGMAVSLIQSLFGAFGSGLVAGDSGVVLQNRGACFAVQGAVEPGKRPYHTIIPGMLLRHGQLVGPFGVMGGFIQAQAHMQLVSALVDDGLDPQAALDRARFRVDIDGVHLEPGLWDRAGELEALGHRIVRDESVLGFGGGQAILRRGASLIGGSDSRKDGFAAGF
jgi:gamma-glutamyltranspeptidase/glutathione hydrolase